MLNIGLAASLGFGALAEVARRQLGFEKGLPFFVIGFTAN